MNVKYVYKSWPDLDERNHERPLLQVSLSFASILNVARLSRHGLLMQGTKVRFIGMLSISDARNQSKIHRDALDLCCKEPE